MELTGNKWITGMEMWEYSLWHPLSDALYEFLSSNFQFTKSLFNHRSHSTIDLSLCNFPFISMSLFFFLTFRMFNYCSFFTYFFFISACFSCSLKIFHKPPLCLWESLHYLFWVNYQYFVILFFCSFFSFSDRWASWFQSIIATGSSSESVFQTRCVHPLPLLYNECHTLDSNS